MELYGKYQKFKIIIVLRIHNNYFKLGQVIFIRPPALILSNVKFCSTSFCTRNYF